MKLILLTILFLSLSLVSSNCPCKNGEIFNESTWQCTAVSNHDQNCVKYLYNNETPRCSTCAKGFYLDPLDSFKCIQQSPVLSNCISAAKQNDQIQCKHCESNFYIKDHQCTPYDSSIPRCNKMNWTQNALKCLSCETGYYVKDNACEPNPSEDPHCLVFFNLVDTPYCLSCPITHYLDRSQTPHKCVILPDSYQKPVNCTHMVKQTAQSDIDCNVCEWNSNGVYILQNNDFSCKKCPVIEVVEIDTPLDEQLQPEKLEDEDPVLIDSGSVMVFGIQLMLILVVAIML